MTTVYIIVEFRQFYILDHFTQLIVLFYPTYCTIVVHQRNERVEAGLAGFEMAPYIVSPVVKLNDKDECEEAKTNDPGDSDTSEDCFAHFFSSDGKIKFLEATSTDLY